MTTLSAESLSDSTDERTQELVTIASIYPDELALNTPFSATVTLPVTPRPPLTAAFPARPDTAPVALSHLPPLELTFELPASYPAAAPPEVAIRIAGDTPWLPAARIAALQAEINNLWEETDHSPVVFAAIDHVQQSAERAFDLAGDGMCELAPELYEPLVEFDRATKTQRFRDGTYDCGICLHTRKGWHCHALRSCTHVFCRSCLVDYYSVLIREGDVSGVRCLDTSCVKKAATAAAAAAADAAEGDGEAAGASLPPTLPPDELREIGLEEAEVQRYVTLKKKKALQKDRDTIYCPRQWCQGPAESSVRALDQAMKVTGNGYWLLPRDAIIPPPPPPPAPIATTTDTPPATPAKKLEKLQRCTACALAFCRICHASWHGDYQICRAPDAELTPEERANEEYLRAHTTPCPTCAVPVLKSHGCNHMVCTCGTHFCFLCSAFLVAANPYAHFNTRGGECYQRLWEGEEGDGGELCGIGGFARVDEGLGVL
ncbi:RWD domain-containing protein [Geopyxis carbonaria]|nr:RWD domain-containing protein [Geopyxis carbonaria]